MALFRQFSAYQSWQAPACQGVQHRYAKFSPINDKGFYEGLVLLYQEFPPAVNHPTGDEPWF